MIYGIKEAQFIADVAATLVSLQKLRDATSEMTPPVNSNNTFERLNTAMDALEHILHQLTATEKHTAPTDSNRKLILAYESTSGIM